MILKAFIILIQSYPCIIGKSISINYSIYLNQPRVSVDLCPKTHDNIFEIKIAPIPRKSKSAFWSKEPSDQKWSFKADSEENIVDWMVKLKSKINSYIPNKPPSPLFKSVPALEVSIQEKVNQNAQIFNDESTGMDHDNSQQVKLMAYNQRNYSDITL